MQVKRLSRYRNSMCKCGFVRQTALQQSRKKVQLQTAELDKKNRLRRRRTITRSSQTGKLQPLWGARCLKTRSFVKKMWWKVILFETSAEKLNFSIRVPVIIGDEKYAVLSLENDRKCEQFHNRNE